MECNEVGVRTMVSNSTKPNLFIIGAMKSGTSYLHQLLSEHPEIFMSEEKEPCYFVDPRQLKKRWPEMWEKGYWKSERNYLQLFQGAENYAVKGESSVEYTSYPLLTGIPDRIKEFNQDSRFLYILRDPIERAVSHYWMYANYYGIKMDPMELLKKKPDFIDISNYALQLKHFFRVFKKDRFFLTTFEALTANPETVYKKILIWLALDDIDFVPPTLNIPKNVSPKKIRAKRGFGLLLKFRSSRVWDKISCCFPPGLTRLASNLAESFYDKNDISMNHFKDHLRSIMIPQQDELMSLIDIDCSAWKTLHGGKF